MAQTIAPRMPLYPPGAPAIGQQLFYGQAPPIIPPQVIIFSGFCIFNQRCTLTILLFIKRMYSLDMWAIISAIIPLTTWLHSIAQLIGT